MAGFDIVFAIIGALAGGAMGLLSFSNSLPTNTIYNLLSNLVVGAIGGLIAGSAALQLDRTAETSFGPLVIAVGGAAGLVLAMRGARSWLLHNRPEFRA